MVTAPERSRAAGDLVRRVTGGVRARLRNAREIGRARIAGEPPVPPRRLRTRVHGSHDVATFRSTGRRCADDVLEAIDDAGVPANAALDVLDFGCGSGRVAGWVARDRPSWRVAGCDIDADAIAWATGAHRDITFNVGPAAPPTGRPDDSVDVLYAISVFTHLDRDAQAGWLREWLRIVRPGGLVLFTVHGPDAVPLDDATRARVEDAGFVFLRDDRWAGVFPDWYQTSVQTRAATEVLVAEVGARVESYRPKGVNDHQDLVVVRVPDRNGPAAP